MQRIKFRIFLSPRCAVVYSNRCVWTFESVFCFTLSGHMNKLFVVRIVGQNGAG
jgi:hypothetical protein